MPDDHLETVRLLADAVSGGNRKSAFACMAPSVIWNATGALVDQDVHHQGRDAVWAYLRNMSESFDGLSAELESVEEIGKLVVARVRLRGTGRASGAASDFAFSCVGRFHGHRIARVDAYVDHEEAVTNAELHAAG